MYIISKIIIISIFNSLKICCATRTHRCRALVAQRGVELGASKCMCYCPLKPHPSYISIYSHYYIKIYISMCTLYPTFRPYSKV